jgi:ATP-dependent DNA helicase DinG
MVQAGEINQVLDVDKALEILKEGGPLSQIFKSYELRPQQMSMMRDVIGAFNDQEIALIEAGTGTGKSLAYLIPAILWAIYAKERTLISTHTITLQEQLLQKDIPIASKALRCEVKAVLVKGMHNYLCERKLKDALLEEALLTVQEAEELHKIEAWSQSTNDGSRSSLPFTCQSNTWEKIAAESDACTRNKCPYYQQCHFFKARRQAQDAQILVVNHHLFFSDLSYRADENGKEGGILPAYTRVILDEAHHIEDIATEYFAGKISQLDILRIMGRLTAEKGGKTQGKLPLLKEKFSQSYQNDFSPQAVSLQNRLSIDIPGTRRDLIQLTHDAFYTLHAFMQTLQRPTTEESQPGEKALRLFPHHYTHPHWTKDVVPSVERLINALNHFAQSLLSLEADFEQLKNAILGEQIRGILLDVNALALRLVQAGMALNTFIEAQPEIGKVRWINEQAMRTMTNVSLVEADLDISALLAHHLFKRFQTVILCSATLTSNQRFDFIRSRLGLKPELTGERIVKEKIYESPFDFQRQALLAVPLDLPNPNESAFIQEASEKIWKAIQASQGNAFILFTSYSMLKAVYNLLEKKLKDHRFHSLKQGDDDRNNLLKKFKTTDRSVLFGTDSFWEGVDVVGDALRCVIIVKLPFKVPSEPIIQARSEAILAQGGDPFMEYSLPQAIVKFKQGFGRLIRNKNDRGCIVCLDPRLLKKSYGKLFLKSLPPCKQMMAPMDLLQSHMAEFYRDTHHLVKEPFSR